jgi:hypothetical protein
VKTNLYQVLGIDPNASQKDVKAALRGLVRKYHQEALDGAGDAEEMLRFVNQAYRVLGNEDSRAKYDAELAVQSMEEPSRPFIVDDKRPTIEPKISEPAKVRRIDKIIETVKKRPLPQLWATKLRMPGVGAGFSKRMGFNLITVLALIALIVWLPKSINIVETLKFFFTWISIAVILASIAYGSIWVVNRLVVKPKQQLKTPPPEMLTLDTDTSIFLGMDEPTAPAAKVLKLQGAVKKAKAEPVKVGDRPWLRLSARLIDYALWGLIVAGILWLMDVMDVIDPETFRRLIHPFVAPVLITGSWVFVETILLYSFNTTPGKWLNNARVNFNVSSSEDIDNTPLKEVFMRSLRVWWRGVGCGVPILSLVTLSVSKQYLDRNHETSWDFDGDCLISHGRLEPVNGFLMITVLSLLIWIYGNAWRQPLVEAMDRPRAFLVQARASLADSLSDLFIREQKAEPVKRSETPEIKVETAPVPVPVPATEIKPTPKTEIVKSEKVETPVPVSTAKSAKSAKSSATPNIKTQAEKLYRDANWEDLLELCKKWTEAEEKNAKAWHYLGVAYYNLQQHKNAVTALQKASKLDPDDKKIKEDLVKSFHAQFGRHEQKESN